MGLQVLLENTPNKTYSLDLEGVVFRINIRYNTLDDKWYFSLLDADGLPLLVGHKVTIDRFMLTQYRQTTFPPGDFLFVLPSANRDPGRQDINDLILYYVEEAEYGEISEII